MKEDIFEIFNDWSKNIPRRFVWFYGDFLHSDLVKANRDEICELIVKGKIDSKTKISWQGGPQAGVQLRRLAGRYLVEIRGEVVAVDAKQLDGLASSMEIDRNTIVWSAKHPPAGKRYEQMSFAGMNIQPSAEEFLESRKNSTFTVVSGPNNSGKSVFLKILRRDMGRDALYLPCNRFYSVSQIAYSDDFENANKSHLDQHFFNTILDNKNNNESSNYQIASLLGHLSDEERGKLFDLCSKIFGEEFSIQQKDPNNKLSYYYVDVGGKNLLVSSTGTRMFLLILSVFFDKSFTTLLIDEPELGLSPELQGKLAEFIQDKTKMNALCPHLEHIYIATHSHIFLDRIERSNNFVSERDGQNIILRSISSITDFFSLQFNMLGNRLDSMFLPTAIVYLEGNSDKDFVDHLIATKFKELKTVVTISMEGEGNTAQFLRVFGRIMGNFMLSPYRDRTFFILDKKNSVKESSLRGLGLQDNNLSKLSENGIEHFYPIGIVREFFDGIDSISDLTICCDGNSYTNGVVTYTKRELCKKVISRMEQDEPIHDELIEKIFTKITSVI